MSPGMPQGVSPLTGRVEARFNRVLENRGRDLVAERRFSELGGNYFRTFEYDPDINGLYLRRQDGPYIYNTGTGRGNTYIPGHDISADGRVTRTYLLPRSQAPNVSHLSRQDAIRHLSLIENSDGSFRRRGFEGTYAVRDNGTVFYGGGYHPNAGNRINLPPQTYINGRWYEGDIRLTSTTTTPEDTTPPPAGFGPGRRTQSPPPIGTAPPPSGTAPPPSGTAPPPSGTAPPPSGTTPPPPTGPQGQMSNLRMNRLDILSLATFVNNILEHAQNGRASLTQDQSNLLRSLSGNLSAMAGEQVGQTSVQLTSELEGQLREALPTLRNEQIGNVAGVFVLDGTEFSNPVDRREYSRIVESVRGLLGAQ